MPRKRRQEKFDRKRGRHKKAASLETRDWNEQRLPPKQERPAWMDAETEAKLQQLRRDVDPWT